MCLKRPPLCGDTRFNLIRRNSPAWAPGSHRFSVKCLFSALDFIPGRGQCYCFVSLIPCFSGGLNSADTEKAFLLSQEWAQTWLQFFFRHVGPVPAWTQVQPTEHLSPGSEKLGLSLLEDAHLFVVVITNENTFLSLRIRISVFWKLSLHL